MRITGTLQISQLTLLKTAEVKFLGCGERVAGIEPAYFAWEANVLPLNYTRIHDVSKILEIISRQES